MSSLGQSRLIFAHNKSNGKYISVNCDSNGNLVQNQCYLSNATVFDDVVVSGNEITSDVIDMTNYKSMGLIGNLDYQSLNDLKIEVSPGNGTFYEIDTIQPYNSGVGYTNYYTSIENHFRYLRVKYTPDSNGNLFLEASMK